MNQTIEAILKNGHIVPLEPLTAEENTPLIVTALKPAPIKSDNLKEKPMAHIVF